MEEARQFEFSGFVQKKKAGDLRYSGGSAFRTTLLLLDWVAVEEIEID